MTEKQYLEQMRYFLGLVWASSEDWSINELASRAGLSHQTVQRLFRGETSLKYARHFTLMRLGSAVGLESVWRNVESVRKAA